MPKTKDILWKNYWADNMNNSEKELMIRVGWEIFLQKDSVVKESLSNVCILTVVLKCVDA